MLLAALTEIAGLVTNVEPYELLDMRPHLGEAAASAKARVMGERCPELEPGFWIRLGLVTPLDRILRRACSGAARFWLPPGDAGNPAL